MLMQQLALPVRLNDEATFANFLVTPANQLAISAVRSTLTPGHDAYCLVRGARYSGRSHLLQALCHAAQAQALTACYLPLAELAAYPAAEVLAGMESQQVLCLDDVEALAGKADWEEAIFHLYNQRQQHGQVLCISAMGGPVELGLQLPDLVSRLSMMLACRLYELNDDARQAALQLRAKGLGFNIPDEVAQFMLRHLNRDMCSLMNFLHRLDHLSLAEKRLITLPFVSELIGRESSGGAESNR